MPTDWTAVRLGDLVRFHKGVSYQGKYLDIPGPKLLGLGTIVPGGGSKVETAREYSGPLKTHHRIRPGEIYVALTDLTQEGAVLGSPAIVPQDTEDEFAVTHHVARLEVVETKKLDTRFLYYLLRSPEARAHMRAMATGTTVRAVAPRDAENLLVELPPFGQQEAIAAVLGALDDKIELNRRMSETLEEIADAVFQSWFVDFKEAEELEASELGLIPSGWSIGPVGNWVDVSGGATPSTKEPDFWQGGAIPWATPKDLSGHGAAVLLDTTRHITPLGLARISSGLLPQGTLLFSSRAPIGYTAIAGQPMAVNQGFIAIPPGGELSPTYMYFWCRTNLDRIKGHAGGSTFAEISKRAFRQIPALLPPAELRDRFDVFAAGILDRATLAQKETMTLIELRDTLLPKLISGELRIPDAEKLVSEVT